MAKDMHAYILDGLRTPVGRYGGALSTIRTDDLAALPIKALMDRYSKLDWSTLDEVILGCANQAGEDSRNVARMASLLAGLPESVGGLTVNRLCASGMDAVTAAARGIQVGEYQMAIAGGVENMSRAPFVFGKAECAFDRSAEIFDSTIGWRFVNPKIESNYGVDSMPETADNVADQWGISRDDQDKFAHRSQQKWAIAQEHGLFSDELIDVDLPVKRGDPIVFSKDEHPRPSTDLAALAKLRAINGSGFTVTAGNASGVNDGSAALLLASLSTAQDMGCTPIARVVGAASVGVSPRVMGIGPVPAIRKLLTRTGVSLDEIDVIEINEAFASQLLACLQDLGLADDDPRVNPLGGAIAIGHPLGMTGARIVLSAAHQLKRNAAKYALCAMCVGVGQGTAVLLERA